MKFHGFVSSEHFDSEPQNIIKMMKNDALLIMYTIKDTDDIIKIMKLNLHDLVKFDKIHDMIMS